MADETQQPIGDAPRQSGLLTRAELANFTEEVVLPAVDKIVDDRLISVRDEMKAGFEDMRKGFEEVKKSIAILSGEIAELKVREEDQKHEQRIQRIEVKLGVRPRRVVSRVMWKMLEAQLPAGGTLGH